jgi:hypothetical protein
MALATVCAVKKTNYFEGNTPLTPVALATVCAVKEQFTS